jgi:hypothetical protein
MVSVNHTQALVISGSLVSRWSTMAQLLTLGSRLTLEPLAMQDSTILAAVMENSSSFQQIDTHYAYTSVFQVPE